jgi:hypothetical protein
MMTLHPFDFEETYGLAAIAPAEEILLAFDQRSVFPKRFIKRL